MFCKIHCCLINHDAIIKKIFIKMAFIHTYLGKKDFSYFIREQYELLCLTEAKKTGFVTMVKHSNVHHFQSILDKIGSWV
jgi:hypothetical protein